MTQIGGNNYPDEQEFPYLAVGLIILGILIVLIFI